MTYTPADAACLRGRTICLVHRGSLRYASRLLQEISALRDWGATVTVLSDCPDLEAVPEEVRILFVEDVVPLRASRSRLRVTRVASNLVRNQVRPLHSRWMAFRRSVRVLRHHSVDLLWVIDWPMLKRYHVAARICGIPIVYETLDLVPEQLQPNRRARALRDETKAVRHASGFITAGSPYADYYAARLGRRPAVRDNTPGTRVAGIKRTARPLRLLFVGAFQANRNLHNLLHALAAIDAELTLTLQGENLLGCALAQQVSELGLEHRVFFKEPVPPGRLVEASAHYDIGVVSLEPRSLNEQLASTTKLFTYMAAGLAIIGSDYPGIRSVVGRHDLGWLVPDASAESWERVLDEVSSVSTEVIDRLKQRSLDAFEEYSWSSQEDAYRLESCRAFSHSPGRRRVSGRPWRAYRSLSPPR